MKKASHEKTNTVRFHLHEVIKLIETESRMEVPRREGRGTGSCSVGTEF